MIKKVLFWVFASIQALIVLWVGTSFIIQNDSLSKIIPPEGLIFALLFFVSATIGIEYLMLPKE